MFLPKNKKGDARVSQCGNCKCAPVCAIKKGMENEMEKLKSIMPVDIREVAEIIVKCNYFIQDKDPNIPDRFQ